MPVGARKMSGDDDCSDVESEASDDGRSEVSVGSACEHGDESEKAGTREHKVKASPHPRVWLACTTDGRCPASHPTRTY